MPTIQDTASIAGLMNCVLTDLAQLQNTAARCKWDVHGLGTGRVQKGALQHQVQPVSHTPRTQRAIGTLPTCILGLRRSVNIIPLASATDL